MLLAYYFSLQKNERMDLFNTIPEKICLVILIGGQTCGLVMILKYLQMCDDLGQIFPRLMASHRLPTVKFVTS